MSYFILSIAGEDTLADGFHVSNCQDCLFCRIRSTDFYCCYYKTAILPISGGEFIGKGKPEFCLVKRVYMILEE